MKFHLVILVAFATQCRTQEEEPNISNIDADESLTTPEPETSPDVEARNYFINRVHSIAGGLSKGIVVNDNKVVWSPLASVNAIVNLDEKENIKLKNGFESVWTFLNAENPLNTTILSSGFTRNDTLLSKPYKTIQLLALKDGVDVNKLLQETFLKLTNFTQDESQGQDGTEAQHGGDLKLNTTFDTVMLTGLGLEALWLTPFHPRYSKKSKFYLNSTHVVKTKMMNNIGFYKYLNLTDFDAEAVAVPLKAPSTYAIFIKPNNPDNLEALNSRLEALENFTDIYDQFKTRRVQLAVPKVNIESQFVIPLSNHTSSLHISSIKISYTGVYNSFHSPVTAYRPVKFTRLRRRKSDIPFKLNTPFIFHIYDSAFSGQLLSGLVLNPGEPEAFLDTPLLMLDPEIKVEREASNDECFRSFQDIRRERDIYDDILKNCNFSTNANYTRAVYRNESLFTFPSSGKRSIKRFWRNEGNYFNTTFFEVIGRVKYLNYGPFDAKIVQLKNFSNHAVYVLIPNERSGLSLIEEGLSHVPFSALVCQMREINLRLRLPEMKISSPVQADNSTITNPAAFGFHGQKVKEMKTPHGDLVEREREGRKKNKKYRKLNVDHPFIFIVTEEIETGGGIGAIGRYVGQGQIFGTAEEK